MRQLNGSGVGSSQARRSGLGANVAKSVADVAHNLGVWHKRNGELEQIAHELQELLGERGTVEAFAWARAKVRGGGTTGSEGARVLALLHSMLRRAAEKRTPRTRALARV